MNTWAKKVVAATAGVLCTLGFAIGGTPIPALASISQAKVVSEDPVDSTPRIVLGTSGETVYSFAQVGSTMYAGGRFTQVQNSGGTVTYPRQNFFAFYVNTGEVAALNLSFDGTVQALVPSTDGQSLYIGGTFKHVNGVASKAIIKYELASGTIDPAFNAPTANGTVTDARLMNGRLIVSGTLTGFLLALDPTTGANTGYINLMITGVSNPGDVTKVRRFATNPAGTTLVALGNFTSINGQANKQTFKLTLGASSALTAWHVPRFDYECPGTSQTAQGIDFSPDGSYFVIVTDGGPSGTDELCDAAARFETPDQSPMAEPTWINWTGGDSLYSVAVTGAAVYVAGHARWLDNPEGIDSKGPGAVDRPGIGAIDPVTGKANSWNPTKSRNHGTERIYATSTGIWVGSDGQNFGGEFHPGIAFCPLPK